MNEHELLRVYHVYIPRGDIDGYNYQCDYDNVLFDHSFLTPSFLRPGSPPIPVATTPTYRSPFDHPRGQE
ncbi:hypothetical protein H0H92_006848 [Tricholoma furcatifolium]|nr:hypothetical protein H0H92_006848 [Tricholoma furcatifolium]